MTNHIVDANKMVQTPRTDELIDALQGNYFSASATDFINLCRTLERELAAAQNEIANLMIQDSDATKRTAERLSKAQARIAEVERELAAANAELTRLRIEVNHNWQVASENERLVAELSALTAEVTQARKEWIGDDHAHLPLGEAIGAVRKSDADQHAELLGELHNAREDLAQRMGQLRNALIERDRYKVEADRKRLLAREFESVLGFTEEEARKEGAIEEAVRRIRKMKSALALVAPVCERLHHPKKYQHPETHPCPCVDIVREAKKIAR